MRDDSSSDPSPEMSEKDAVNNSPPLSTIKGHSDSEKESLSKKATSIEKYTIEDLYHAYHNPPNWKAKWMLRFYKSGWALMPTYLQDIYNKVPRYVYVNFDVPEIYKDPQGGHLLINYPRNKIRTTKYTPMSFLPKNLMFQFSNVANVYFLMLIILGAFSIFGVDSPGLAAVPLIVIVCITALKDIIEDYQRGNSDSELNNYPVHLLVGMHNPNVEADYVNTWRRFKKGCTRATNATFRGLYKAGLYVFGSKKAKVEYVREQHQLEANELRRVSTVHSEYTYNSGEYENPGSAPRLSLGSYRRKSTQGRRSKERLPFSQPHPNSILNPQVIASESGGYSVFKSRNWKNINVGDFIRIRANEEVPADVVLLLTSEPEGNCHIETKNLDGETNLKSKSVLQCGGATNLKHSRDLGNTKFWIECDAPNKSLYAFKGTIHYENYDSKGTLINPDEKEAITNNNVLLRGSTLRNTKWVIGVVVYTGAETKIMLNSGITPTKASKISRELNISVFINFALLFVMCFASGLINGLYYNEKHVSRLYFDFKPYASTSAANGIIAFFVALIIYQSLVPISLYVSIEIIKTLQAFFIFSDLKMYYEKLNFPCIPKAWNISDDLGQIEYIFSDKTGTLTQNVMEFKKCTIVGKLYGLAYTEAKQGLDKRMGKDVIEELKKWSLKMAEDKSQMIENLKLYSHNDQLVPEKITFLSNEFVKDTILEPKDKKRKFENERFMLALALCHTVVTEEDPENPHLRQFKAESPDEAALVSAAHDIGIVFTQRMRKSLILTVYGEKREYELLSIIQFTSARKKMSCIVKTPENKILLICKGADSAIFLILDPRLNNQDTLSKTALHLEDYAQEGLRTLCIAQKEMDLATYENWNARYKEAESLIDDSRDEILANLEAEIEQGLILLGGTAIEDRLQDGVPDSISILGKAGIKLWVLTGDRVETAINIGFSCNLLESNMKLLVVRPEDDNPDNFEYIDHMLTTQLKDNFGINASDSATIEALIEEAREDHSTPTSNHALIIDGAALTLIFDTEHEHSQDIQSKFLLLGKQCKSVLCCRVSPAQKAFVVKMVKNSLKVMTLAIGDGANDVAMIQAANVGVGIAGEEGRQAVMSSDYAIGQFRYLTRLLLVHGRWSYKRLAEMVPCFFYKNVVFTLTCMWYGIYNNFDGSYLYEYTFLMFYNLAFTSLPVIFLAVLDQDVSDSVSLLVPQLYRSGILGEEWTQYKFVWYMFDGLYQSVVAFWFPYLVFYRSFPNPQGLPIDHRFWVGVVATVVSVTSCNLYVLLQQYRWDWLTLLINFISSALVFFWAGVWSASTTSGEFYKAAPQVFGTLACWCVFFVGISVCILPRFTYDFLKINFFPRDIDIIRELVKKGYYDDYPQGYDPTNAEDVERHRLVVELTKRDPSFLDKLEKEVEHQRAAAEHDGGDELPKSQEQQHHHNNPFSNTIGSIKRKITITSPGGSRRGTVSGRSRKNTISESFRYPVDINLLREQMIRQGEYNSSRHSMDRVSTTHEVPGLTQAESLIRLHTRNSMQLT